ncbi:MAG: EF-P lysine aminoacylase EpmA, partial [Acidobacteriota bacterium]
AKRPALDLRGEIVRAVREFFRQEGFLEVQTPLLTPSPAPEPHIEAVPADEGRFLITSPELYMKRLLAAGYEKIFQISPAFRRGERGRLHHPEFTILEWYRLHADYKQLQEDCQRLIRFACKTVARAPGDGWANRGHRLEPEGDWECYTVKEAFLKFAGWAPDASVDQDRFDVDMVEKVEPRLGFPRPCILQDYPANQAALARLKPGDGSVAERFELYWAGVELANGFSELTDASEQRMRFEEAREMQKRMGRIPYPSPEAFLESLDHLSPCAGIALGLDRLVMLLAGADSLDEVVAFPPSLL